MNVSQTNNLHRPFHEQKILLWSANVSKPNPAPLQVLDLSPKSWARASNVAKLRCHRPVREHGIARSRMRREPTTLHNASCIVSGFLGAKLSASTSESPT